MVNNSRNNCNSWNIYQIKNGGTNIMAKVRFIGCGRIYNPISVKFGGYHVKRYTHHIKYKGKLVSTQGERKYLQLLDLAKKTV